MILQSSMTGLISYAASWKVFYRKFLLFQMAWIMNHNSLMTFGKYKGIRIGDLRADYLLWIYDNRKWGRHRDLLVYLREHEQELRREAGRTKRNNELINELSGDE